MGGIAASRLTTCWQVGEKRREIEVTYLRAIVADTTLSPHPLRSRDSAASWGERGG